MVMINLQQTAHDGKSCLRILGESDNVLKTLLAKMGIANPAMEPRTFELERRFLVPYDGTGTRSKTVSMWLDLNAGSLVKVVCHNIKGANQPSHAHVKKGASGTVFRWNSTTSAIELRIQGTSFLLGFWWLEAARNGRTPTIPIVNVRPGIKH
jgi:hypothetical protein